MSEPLPVPPSDDPPPADQPGAYPPPVYQPGAYPPGAYPPGAYPPGAYPPGVFALGAYPSGGYSPAAPPKKPRRNLRTVLIVVAAVVAVCCVGGVVGGSWLVNKGIGSIGSAKTTATTYLDDIKAGDVDAAYGMLCSATRDRVSRSEYGSMIPSLRSYEITGVRVSSVNGQTRGAVSVRMDLTTGGSVNETLGLSKTTGDWQICDA